MNCEYVLTNVLCSRPDMPQTCQDPADGKASDVVSAGEEALTCHSLVLDVRAQ